MEKEQKNIFLAIGLSTMVLFGFNYFYKTHNKESEISKTHQTIVNTVVTQKQQTKPLNLDRDEALSLSKRTFFETKEYKGSVHLNSGLLDDLVLKQYTETVEPQSPHVKILNPMESKNAHYVEFSPQDVDSAQNIPVQFEILKEQADSLHLISRSTEYDIERIYTFNSNYRIHVEDKVTNKTNQLKKLRGYSGIQKLGTPETQNMNILHEGVVGVIQGSLEELSYKKLGKIKEFSKNTDNGWIGFTDKYFMTSLLFKDKTNVVSEKFDHGYNAKVYSSTVLVEPHKTVSFHYDVFSGPKELKLLEKIEKAEGIKKFDLAVDFGWLYFLTKPLFKLLTWLNELFHSFGWALIVITLMIKLLLFPMSVKAHRSMKAMKLVQTKIEAIRLRFPDDKIRQQQEIMQLYQREKIRPAAGCLPILVQIPIFFCLYKVLYITIEMRHAPFIGWVKDLSVPDTLYFTNAFGLLDFSVPHMLQIGLWPVLMGVSMFIQQKMTPVSDPAQEKAMMIMPLLFTFLFAGFPVGLVIYWTLSNILSIIQQWVTVKYWD